MPTAVEMDGMFALCDHVASAVFGGVAPAPFAGAWPERPMDAALNCPGGHVALALVALLGAGRFERDGGFGEAIRRSLDAIVDADGHDGLAARVILVGDLAFLDDVDPCWTAGRLLPRLGCTSAEAAVLWRVRSGRRIGRARLFNALKPAFMHEVARPDLGLAQSAGLAANLMQAASWKLDPAAYDLDLTFQEVRNLLATSTTAVRTAAARMLLLVDGSERAHRTPTVRPIGDLRSGHSSRTSGHSMHGSGRPTARGSCASWP